MDTLTTRPSIDTYLVQGANDDFLTAPFTVQLIATSEDAAIRRARGSAMHLYRHMWPYDSATVWTIVRRRAGVHMDGDI